MTTQTRDTGIADRISAIRGEIESAMARCGRLPGSVQLIAVTKGFPPEDAIEAFLAGTMDLGENRVQELLLKSDLFDQAHLSPRWHLIGTLQKNKVKHIVGRTALIHSVDSLPLLSEISERSIAKGLVTEVLLQVNVSLEPTKHGFAVDEASAALLEGTGMAGVRIRGLMTMAPPAEDAEDVRPFFVILRELLVHLRGTLPADDASSFDLLSMGMSHDFRIAIEEGASHVRIGTAIFGTGRR